MLETQMVRFINMNMQILSFANVNTSELRYKHPNGVRISIRTPAFRDYCARISHLLSFTKCNTLLCMHILIHSHGI